MTPSTSVSTPPKTDKRLLRDLFGVPRTNNDVSMCFDMIEIADDVIGQVGVDLAHNGSALDFTELHGHLTNAERWLRAAESALTILDNPDWKDDLDMAQAGLRVVSRLRFCLLALERDIQSSYPS